jgi:hypothetical protein
VVLQYISTDEKIADILVKPMSKMKFCILKGQVGARGDEFLIEKGSDYSQVGRENLYVIDIWTVIFQFGKWSRLGSSFPVRKVVRDF